MQVGLNLRVLEVVFRTILDFFSVFTDQTLSCLIQFKSTISHALKPIVYRLRPLMFWLSDKIWFILNIFG